MSSSVKMISKILSISTIVIGICILPLIFSSGCNYDPYQNIVTSDTTTYKVSGVVTTAPNKPVNEISVTLYDSINSSQSSPVMTNALGKYDISWPYLRRTNLLLKFEDVDTTFGTFVNDSVTISFDENYFKYPFQKTQNKQLVAVK
jgi:putative lipoprotein (rSAM/lipoprotein system)